MKKKETSTRKNGRFTTRACAIFAAAICLCMLFAACPTDDPSEDPPQIATTPTATPAGGEVADNTAITLATATEGAKVYYTQDGTEPNTASALYSDSDKPVITTGKLTLKAIAIKDGMNNSETLTAVYTIIVIPTYTVTFDVDNGTENTTQTVTEGNTVTKPINPIKPNDMAGLYKGTSNDYAFIDWYKLDDTAWDFSTETVTTDVTLKAKWIAPTPIDITIEIGNNIVEKAVSFVNTHNGNTYTLVLGENVINVNPQILDQNDTTLIITSDGDAERKICLGQTGELFRVGGPNNDNPRRAKLIINGHVTLEGKVENNNRVVYVQFGGSLDLNGNSKITGDGIGIQIYGGASEEARAYLTMNDNSEISKMSRYAVYIRNNGIFTMNDNSVIKNNSECGITVGDSNGGTFIMNGGRISNNTSSDYGGGVIIREGTFIMNGGEISFNSATNYGGGVSIGGDSYSGFFIVANDQVKSSIHNNTATNGSQVYVNSFSTFTVGGESVGSF
jgi:hypothetical protein